MSVPSGLDDPHVDPPWGDLPGSIAQMLLACDASGRAQTVSRQWLRFTGQSVDEAMGAGWHATLTATDGLSLSERWCVGVVQSRPFDCEVRIRRHDGQWRLFRLIASPFDDGVRDGFWCVCATDIDDLRQVSMERDRALATLHAHLEELPIGFMRFDLQMNVRYLNPAAERTFGWRGEELVGRSAFGTIVDAEQVDLVSTIAVQVRESSGPVGSINENRTRDGRTIVCEWSSTAERDADNHVTGVRSTVVDVTARIRHEERQARDAHRVSELTRQLISAQEDERKALSLELHDELGQQLAALRIGLASLASRDPSPSTRQRLSDCLAIVESAIARVRRRALELRPSMLDEIGLLGTLDWFCAQQQDMFGVPVVLRGTVPSHALPQPVVTAAYRIVQEAVSNALRHGAPSRVEVTVSDEDGWLLVSVRDDGCGFDAAQVDSRSGRSGIGLQGMRERALLIGGGVRFDSRPGEGATVQARLPVKVPVHAGAF